MSTEALPNNCIENMRARRVRKPKDAPPPAPEALADMKAYARERALAHILNEHLRGVHDLFAPSGTAYEALKKRHEQFHAGREAAEDFEAVPAWEWDYKVAGVYVTPATGNMYLSGGKGMAGSRSDNWRGQGPVYCEFFRSTTARPLVDLDTIFGGGATYTPDQLRAIAAALARIADDADAHPMGPRSFFRSSRGYRVEVAS